jgi:hypothetical protein
MSFKRNLFFILPFLLSILSFKTKGEAATEKQTLVPVAILTKHLEGYAPKEKELIQADANRIQPFCLHPAVKKEKHYVATAGSPGACKSTILERYLEKETTNSPAFVPQRCPFAYIDPDQGVLKFMFTYRSALNMAACSHAPSFEKVLASAYSKWRGGSNFISNTLLNQAFASGSNIAHGTTSTSPSMEAFYQKLKKRGYRITLLLCFSPPENCARAIRYRNTRQGFVQSTGEDLKEKARMFYERIPVYLKYSDEVHLYYTGRFWKEPSAHVATYTREKGLKISNTKGLGHIKRLYDTYHNQNETSPSFQLLFSKIHPVQKEAPLQPKK